MTVIIITIITALTYHVLPCLRHHALGFMDLVSFHPCKIPVRSMTFISQMGKLRLGTIKLPQSIAASK